MRNKGKGANKLVDADDDIEIVDYDPFWNEGFLRERESLARALGSLALEIHHIGSTAVPELAAKPIIDIMVAVQDISTAAGCTEILVPLGYVHVAQDDPDRLFFRKGSPRTHHLHLVKAGTWAYHKHLWFRDYLIDHPGTAEEYECLKRVLASRHRSDRSAYVQGKDDLVALILERAARERLIFRNGSV